MQTSIVDSDPILFLFLLSANFYLFFSLECGACMIQQVGFSVPADLEHSLDMS